MKKLSEEVVKNVNKKKGKKDGWPACFEYDFNEEEQTAIIRFEESFKKKNFRRLDPWALAFVEELKKEAKVEVRKIIFNIQSNDNHKDMEAFRRRFSFLKFNNPRIYFEAFTNGEPMDILTQQELFNPPQNEIIRNTKQIKERRCNDQPGRLEKDFQVFLFGSGRKSTEGKVYTEHTNERLAVLGEDFFGLKDKPILREFPTGVFQKVVKKETHILPTEFIDLLTMNKNNNLSIIELKLNDSSLEVISQLLDYALFFRRHRESLLNDLKEGKFNKLKSNKIICYVVNNHFHPWFDKILKYYATDNKDYGFEIKPLQLGYVKPFRG